ncbi:ATP-dependent helicase HrpB [Thiomicrospira sp. ALE5]|uniref:ATP-dependent helicase HrpB n=1 Tax=Thiomicrospira sp. ALE5 TaxID=748650 RepID=UPI0008EFE17F|nr:ATP-dependent helicase HrpB [Thiomicrospira sp. ALE5]SFR56285.1 ATP-dependent helicase HrpB [Thiomicrospira sp. ALE5]
MTLPISPLLPQIVATLAQAPGLVLQAEPGAGKSTAVPLALLNADGLAGKKILMLEPRRLAVRSIANYLASQLGEKVGQTIGYQIRNERKVSASTRLEIVTEGILTRRLQSDPELSDVALVIFDEFHERSIHADLALTLCLDVQAGLRDDLKLLVMSATMDAEQVSVFLNNAPVLCAQGRSFPVETHYLPQPLNSTHPQDWLPLLKQLISQALKTARQDVLVFLPGQAEIKRLQSLLQESLLQNAQQPGLVVCPLYGQLAPEQQEIALVPDPQGRRKIILATNIAETSLTIDGIDAVVDSGWARKAVYDVSSGMTRLVTQRISQASADQRRGRAGRLMAGVCYRLWSQGQQAQMQVFEAEEITQTDLSDLCLELALWGVSSPDELRWLTAPPLAHYAAAKSLLQDLDLLTDKGGLTELGRSAQGLGLNPRLARMLLSVQTQSADRQTLALDLAALLAEGDILRHEPSADLIKRLMVLQAYRQDRKQAKQDYVIQTAAIEQALKNADSWRKQLRFSAPKVLSLAQMQTESGSLVALAFPDRIAQRRKGDTPRYLLSNGKGALLKNEDPLGQQAWLAIANLDGQRQEGRIYLAAPLDLASIEHTFSTQIERHIGLGFDAKKRELIAREQMRLGKLVLSEKLTDAIKPSEFQTALLEVLANHLDLLPWTDAAQDYLTRLRWLADLSQTANADWPSYDQAWLSANIERWLAPYLSGISRIKELQKLDMVAIMHSLLDYEQQQVLEREAPRFYHAPSDKKVAIDYSQPKIAKVSLQLQEVFGELSSPRLAWRQVALTFELLSPARRPIQTTADLAYFWRHSYFEVIKDMKGRYPRHRWPDKPLDEKPGRSVKPRPIT